MRLRTAAFLTSLLLPAYVGTLALEQSDSAQRYAKQYPLLARQMSALQSTYPVPGSSAVPTPPAVRARVAAAERLATHAFYRRGVTASARLVRLREMLDELRALTRTQLERLTRQSRAAVDVIRLERLQSASLYRLRRATHTLFDRTARAMSTDSARVARRTALALGLFVAVCSFVGPVRRQDSLPVAVVAASSPMRVRRSRVSDTAATETPFS